MIQTCVLVLWLVGILVGCDHGGRNVAPRNLASLGDDVRSGMTLEEIQRLDSLHGCTWDVRQVERFGPEGEQAAQPAIQERIRTDAVSESCKHLGVSGSIRLEFVNDRLLGVRFVPDDVAGYRAAVEQQLGEPVEDNKQYHLGHDVIVQIVDQNGTKAALWQDADLVVWMLSGS